MIDERFPVQQVPLTLWGWLPFAKGAKARTQKIMRKVTARNSKTIRRWFQDNQIRINGNDVLNAVGQAEQACPNKLCTDFARNLRRNLYGPAAAIPVSSREVIRIRGMDNLVEQIEHRTPAAGTVLLLANNGNVHMTTIVGYIDGRAIIVEQHPANPQVAFKTLRVAMDEWRLARALTPSRAGTVDAIFDGDDACLGVVPPP